MFKVAVIAIAKGKQATILVFGMELFGTVCQLHFCGK